MCFRPFEVSEDQKIQHEAKEMASHATGRKYNVTSARRGGGKKKKTAWQSMGIGNSNVQCQTSVPVEVSALANARWNPRFQGNSIMDGRILFFFPETVY
jgi:hypothetical protein